jgi:hypothetical protein
VKNVVLVAVTICLIAVSVSVIDLNLRGRKLLVDTDAAVLQMEHDSTEAAKNVNQILEKVSIAAQRIDDASEENRKYYAQATRQAAGTIKALRLFLDRADRQLNDGLLPELQKSVWNFDKNSEQSLTALTQAADSLNLQLADPHISNTVENLDSATADLAVTSEHLDHISAIAEAEARRLTKPASLAKRIGMGILEVGSQLGSIAAGFAK